MKPLFFAKPMAFRKWFEKNHEKEQEVWVGFYKKGSGKPSITWPESVDEALCFGWIDGIRKSIDEDSYMIRFTPRRPGSIWSTNNIEKIKNLNAKGLLQPAGIAAFERRSEKKSGVYSFEQKAVTLDPAYLKQFKENAKAYKWFTERPQYYQRVATWWIMSAKQESTRHRRLKELIKDSEEGRVIKSQRWA